MIRGGTFGTRQRWFGGYSPLFQPGSASMVHFSIFGGHDGQLSASRCVYINIFGGTTLTRPPLASRLIGLRAGAGRPLGWQHFFFNLMGGTTVKWPTVAAEFLALTNALRTGGLTLDEWNRALSSYGDIVALHTGSFSMFGGVNTDALPDEDKELDDLSLQRHAGTIPEPALQQLMLAVGQNGAQRLHAVYQAALVALSASGDAARAR
jgi:hypothetical protein